MSVGILIVTHDAVGKVLLETAVTMLGMCPLQVEVLPVRRDQSPEQLLAQAQRLADKVDIGDGLLVLTDMYGSTPSNVAAQLLHREKVCALAGINLPMLVRILNYPRLSLDELLDKAIDGGREGVVSWREPPEIPYGQEKN